MQKIELKKWTIRPTNEGICVDGLRLDDGSGLFWHSSSITKRISSRLLETSSGAQYHLVGNLDQAYSEDASDYLWSVTNQFKRGFPVNWKTLVEYAKKNGSSGRMDTLANNLETNSFVINENMKNKQENGVSAVVNIRRRQVSARCYSSIGQSRGLCQTPGHVEFFCLNGNEISSILSEELEKNKNGTFHTGGGLEDSLDNTLDDTILALRTINLPNSRLMRKRKQSDAQAVDPKRCKTDCSKTDCSSKKTDVFLTPEVHVNDVALKRNSCLSRTQHGKIKRVRMNTENCMLFPCAEETGRETNKISNEGDAYTMLRSASLAPGAEEQSYLDCIQVIDQMHWPKSRSRSSLAIHQETSKSEAVPNTACSDSDEISNTAKSDPCAPAKCQKTGVNAVSKRGKRTNQRRKSARLSAKLGKCLRSQTKCHCSCEQINSSHKVTDNKSYNKGRITEFMMADEGQRSAKKKLYTIVTPNTCRRRHANADRPAIILHDFKKHCTVRRATTKKKAVGKVVTSAPKKVVKVGKVVKPTSKKKAVVKVSRVSPKKKTIEVGKVKPTTKKKTVIKVGKAVTSTPKKVTTSRKKAVVTVTTPRTKAVVKVTTPRKKAVVKGTPRKKQIGKVGELVESSKPSRKKDTVKKTTVVKRNQSRKTDANKLAEIGTGQETSLQREQQTEQQEEKEIPERRLSMQAASDATVVKGSDVGECYHSNEICKKVKRQKRKACTTSPKKKKVPNATLR